MQLDVICFFLNFPKLLINYSDLDVLFIQEFKVLESFDILVTEGKSVVVLEAAVLLKAGWEDLCHEVWGCIIPVKEVSIK